MIGWAEGYITTKVVFRFCARARAIKASLRFKMLCAFSGYLRKNTWPQNGNDTRKVKNVERMENDSYRR